MITLHNVDRYYKAAFGNQYVLRNIALEIAEGDFVSIMGPSGAGKTTLLHILGMLDSISDGEYYFCDRAVHLMKEGQRSEMHRQHIGFVFQSYHLLDELTVYENLETPLMYKGIKNKERKGLIADALDRFNIVAKRDLFPSQLSGGQQQLVAVARATITRPRLLLADEPTGNLNSQQGKEIMELFSLLNKEGCTIVQVTHSEKNASYGRRLVLLEDGLIRH